MAEFGTEHSYKSESTTALRLALISSSNIFHQSPTSSSSSSTSSSTTTTTTSSSTSSTSSSSHVNRSPSSVVLENSCFDILRSLLNYSSFYHRAHKFRIPMSPLIAALGTNGLRERYLVNLPNHVLRQLYQRTNLPTFKRHARCDVNDLSGGHETFKIPISTNSPPDEIRRLLQQYRDGSKVYMRFPIESHTLLCLFASSGKRAPSHFCLCKPGARCNPTNNKETGRSCGGKHGSEKDVFHVCNFLCSCGGIGGTEPCGGTEPLMGVNVRLELFWRQEMNEWGVRAKQKIRAGTVIGEYPGLLQNGGTTRALVTKKSSSGGSGGSGAKDFLSAFVADPKSSRSPSCIVEVDAGTYRSVTYYINHTCRDPTLAVKQFCDSSRLLLLEKGGAEIPFRRTLFVAKRAIRAGEELTFKYEKNGGGGKTNNFLEGKVCLCTSCQKKQAVAL
jgi:hypothetical protein